MTSKNGGTSKPSPLIQAIAIAHSRLPGCTVLPLSRRSERVTTIEGHMTPHHEARLVEVVQIAVEDAEFAARVEEQAEPVAQKIGILKKSSLVIVGAQTASAEFFPSLNEAIGPLFPNTTCATRREDAIRHHPHIFERGREPSRIQVQYILDYCCLLEGGQNLSSRPTFRDSRATHSVAESNLGYIIELRSSTTAQSIDFLDSTESQNDSCFVVLFPHGSM